MRRLAVLALAGLAIGALVAPTGASSTPGPDGAMFPLGQAGTWLTDAQGRVVILHGLNQVAKTSPYLPSQDGFGDDDAAFLADNGFNAVRVGVIWAGVEPRPGVYDDTYLNGIAATVTTLADHGIVSLLDFHQDMYNERFQGEGAPAWATYDGGLLNPTLGFPGNYFGNPAQEHAWDAFWQNAPGPDGVGLQDHYARAWAHVAARFHDVPSVVGYEVMNEPWPGTLWEQCAVPLVGCPLFDAQLTRFYQRVSSAIRSVDSAKTMWVEPNVLFGYVDATNVGDPHDPHLGWTFHDYCAFEAVLQNNTLCPALDEQTVSSAQTYATAHGIPWLMTEFGATTDLANLSSMLTVADAHRLGWLEWAYTGHDITSSSPDGQALVLDPSQPPTGANVLTDKLRVLAEPYPQAVAGTPTSWRATDTSFTLSYATARGDGSGSFPAGSITDVAVPRIRFPNGYQVSVTGGVVVSAPNAAHLRIASAPGATSVQVSVS